MWRLRSSSRPSWPLTRCRSWCGRGPTGVRAKSPSPPGARAGQLRSGDRHLRPCHILGTGLGFGWLNAVDVPKVITIAPFTVLGQALQLVLNLFELDPTGWAAIRAARVFGVLVAGVVIAWMAVTIARTRPLQFLAYAYLAAALALPAVRSWYLLWGGLLLPLSSTPRKVFSIAIWRPWCCSVTTASTWPGETCSMALGLAAAGGIWWLARTHQSPALADSKEERDE